MTRGRAFALMYLAAQTANNVHHLGRFWAGAIGASNTMVLGGFISIAATALIGVLWRRSEISAQMTDVLTRDSSCRNGRGNATRAGKN